MKFKWMKAKCFLSIGSKGVHVVFENLNNIVVVKGKNLDISPESSNGAGKSTLIEALIYGLFGKLIKGLPHKEALNKKLKKGLEIELCFDLNGSEYRIFRSRKPDSLDLYIDGVKQTVGGMPDTQKEIENIIKLNYEAFINVACFGEHNNHAFLACDAAAKRSIVENLLGLEKYLKFCKIAKDGLKEIEAKLTVSRKKYETCLEQREDCIKRISQLIAKQKSWKAGKENEIQELNLAIATKSKDLLKTDDGHAAIQYQYAQDRIRINKDKLVKFEEQRSKIASMLDQIRTKLEHQQELKNNSSMLLKSKEGDINSRKKEINLIQSQIDALNKLQPGVKCPACFGTVDPHNYQHLIDHNTKLLADMSMDITTYIQEKEELSKKFNSHVSEVNKLTELKKQADGKNQTISNELNDLLTAIQKDSQIKEPQVGARELVLKEQIKELTNRVEAKKNELANQDPYVEIIAQATQERTSLTEKIDEYKALLDEGEALIPYYEFWIDGFGDDGIRAFVIDDVLPALNARINYWLQFLIDNKITLKFDNKFDVVIERNPPDGDPFVYNATSGGERRRINLAISQAFAHVMMIAAGTCPSIISLDEVALNVDVPGVHGIFKMIGELAKDRQVLVTSHDPNLNDLLSSCDVLTVVKKDGFTELE